MLFISLAPPTAVQLLKAPEKIDKCDFLLKWKKASDDGSPTTKYKVYQRKVVEKGPKKKWKKINSTNAQECHVSNLKRGEVYEFKVKATNKYRQGGEAGKSS